MLKITSISCKLLANTTSQHAEPTRSHPNGLNIYKSAKNIVTLNYILGLFLNFLEAFRHYLLHLRPILLDRNFSLDSSFNLFQISAHFIQFSIRFNPIFVFFQDSSLLRNEFNFWQFSDHFELMLWITVPHVTSPFALNTLLTGHNTCSFEFSLPGPH